MRFFWPKGGWKRAFHYVHYRLRRLPDSSQKISRGIWAGLFATFTPFYGLHFLTAAIIARLLKGNILAALLATFFGNPLTYFPIGAISIKTGNFILGNQTENLEKVLISVKNGIAESKKLGLHLPIFLKISPDITENNLNLIIEIANKNNISGLIISNTTVDRYKDLHPDNLHEEGGLSGKPLFTKSTTLLALANKIIKHKKYNLYLIAAGGVLDAKSAYAKILCGAHLVQLYSSMTFVGPLIADNILKGLQQLMNRDKISSINDVRGIVDNPEAAMKIANDGIIDNFQT